MSFTSVEILLCFLLVGQHFDWTVIILINWRPKIPTFLCVILAQLRDWTRTHNYNRKMKKYSWSTEFCYNLTACLTKRTGKCLQRIHWRDQYFYTYIITMWKKGKIILVFNINPLKSINLEVPWLNYFNCHTIFTEQKLGFNCSDFRPTKHEFLQTTLMIYFDLILLIARQCVMWNSVLYFAMCTEYTTLNDSWKLWLTFSDCGCLRRSTQNIRMFEMWHYFLQILQINYVIFE